MTTPPKRNDRFEARRQQLIRDGAIYRADIARLKNITRSKLLGAPATDAEGHPDWRNQVTSGLSRFANLRTLKNMQAFLPIATGVISLLSRRSMLKPLAKTTVVATAVLGLLRLVTRKKIQLGAKIKPVPVPPVLANRSSQILH